MGEKSRSQSAASLCYSLWRNGVNRFLTHHFSISCVLLSLLLFVAARRIWRDISPFYPEEWVQAVGSKDDDLLTIKQVIRAQLEQLTADTADKPEINPLKLAELTSVAGRKTTIWAFVDQVTPDSIGPPCPWKQVREATGVKDPKFLILSSVNPREEKQGAGIESALFPGCLPDFRRHSNTPLGPGDISVYPCEKGDLNSAGMAWVSNHNVTPEGRVGSPVCFEAGCATDEQYEARLVSKSILNLFAYLRDHPSIEPDGLLMTALGTGNYQMSLDAFYQQTSKQVVLAISNKEYASHFPRNIFYLVFLGDLKSSDQSRWEGEKEAISDATADLVRIWRTSPHSQPQHVEALTGVLSAILSMAVLLLFLAAGRPRIAINKGKWPKVIESVLALLGSFSVFQALAGSPGESGLLPFRLTFTGYEVCGAAVLLVVGLSLIYRNLTEKAEDKPNPQATSS